MAEDFMAKTGYILVADRLAAFVKDYPNGRIDTSLVSITNTMVVVSARVWRNRQDDAGVPPDGTGLSSMPVPGPTSFSKNAEVEVAETSAIGRALAAIGYLSKNADGHSQVASSDEIAAKSPEPHVGNIIAAAATANQDPPITQKQRGMLMSMAKAAGMDPNTPEGKKELRAVTLAATGKHSSKQLTNADVDLLVAALSA